MRATLIVLCIWSTWAAAERVIEPVALFYGPESDRIFLIEADPEDWATYVTRTRPVTDAHRRFDVVADMGKTMRIYVGPRDDMLPRRVTSALNTALGEWTFQLDGGPRFKLSMDGETRIYDLITKSGNSSESLIPLSNVDPREIDQLLNVRRDRLEVKTLMEACGLKLSERRTN